MQVNLNRIEMIVVGRAGAGLEPVIADYERRLGRRARVNVTVVKGEPLERGVERVLAAEGRRILAAVDRVVGASGERATRSGAGAPEGATIIACCDARGVALTSEELASTLLAATRLVLVIGGAMGLHPDVRAGCPLQISLGRVTLPHQIARLVATEQLYRAFAIARGEPYHH